MKSAGSWYQKPRGASSSTFTRIWVGVYRVENTTPARGALVEQGADGTARVYAQTRKFRVLLLQGTELNREFPVEALT